MNESSNQGLTLIRCSECGVGYFRATAVWEEPHNVHHCTNVRCTSEGVTISDLQPEENEQIVTATVGPHFVLAVKAVS